MSQLGEHLGRQSTYINIIEMVSLRTAAIAFGAGLRPIAPPHPQTDRALPMDSEQMFRLIDSILPFEACLYYQILPLSLEGSYLKLGMVNPQDNSALDYARRILAYLNCSLKPQLIKAEVHQAMLSAYLNHLNTVANNPKFTSGQSSTIQQDQQPTLIIDRIDRSDSPELETKDNFGQNQKVPINPPPLAAKTKPPTSFLRQATATNPNQPNIDRLPALQVKANYLSSPIEVLKNLPPPQLLAELLGRVLIGGIGRLYFERQENSGRILWSQDGILQSVLEGLDLPVFQGAINELKMMAHLSLITVEQPRQVEIERRYLQERLLLCLRVMPGKQGEEATLQVLRGAALKFYQQQQVEKLSHDALSLAQQLQLKLDQIRQRAHLHQSPTEALVALDRLLASLEQQMAAIKKMQINHQSEEPPSGESSDIS